MGLWYLPTCILEKFHFYSPEKQEVIINKSEKALQCFFYKAIYIPISDVEGLMDNYPTITCPLLMHWSYDIYEGLIYNLLVNYLYFISVKLLLNLPIPSVKGEICQNEDLYLTHWGWLTHLYASAGYPSLVQIMACRLNGAKPLSEPTLEYC